MKINVESPEKSKTVNLEPSQRQARNEGENSWFFCCEIFFLLFFIVILGYTWNVFNGNSYYHSIIDTSFFAMSAHAISMRFELDVIFFYLLIQWRLKCVGYDWNGSRHTLMGSMVNYSVRKYQFIRPLHENENIELHSYNIAFLNRRSDDIALPVIYSLALHNCILRPHSNSEVIQPALILLRLPYSCIKLR